MNKKLIVCMTVGLPGSGKSTWAKQEVATCPNIKRINKDDLRSMLDNGVWDKTNENFVLKVRDEMVKLALSNGHNVIIDDTNFEQKHFKSIQKIIDENNFNAEIITKSFLHIPLDECIKNDLKRFNSVGEKVIRSMYNKYIANRNELIDYKNDKNLVECIICDLDGTLAFLNGRNPYDATNCDNDIVNHAVLDILINYQNGKVFTGLQITGYKPNNYIIFVSGREDKYKEPTLSFLNKHGFSLDENVLLFMRKTGDNRKDSIIKEEIFNTEIKDKFFVKYVIDDRLQVCRMWHSLGLPLLRYGNPDLEF